MPPRHCRSKLGGIEAPLCSHRKLDIQSTKSRWQQVDSVDIYAAHSACSHQQVFTRCHQALAWKLADSSQMNRAVQASKLDHFTQNNSAVHSSGLERHRCVSNKLTHGVTLCADYLIFSHYFASVILKTAGFSNKNWQKLHQGTFLFFFFFLSLNWGHGT